jgi:long-chain acyl-CoA synthetase
MSEKLKAIFEEMKNRFRPGVLEKRTSYYFSLGEGEGAKWTLYIGPEECEIVEGKDTEKADCVLKTSEDFFSRMVLDDYMPGFSDFMMGKIKTNDPDLLKLFKEAFD